MSWAIGFSENQNRDVGYAVPAICDHPGCTAEIDRGIAYMCCEISPDHHATCGGFYCAYHRESYIYGDELDDMDESELEAHNIDKDSDAVAEAIDDGDIVKCLHEPIEKGKENAAWLEHCLKDETWQDWRNENPAMVTAYQEALKNRNGNVCFVQVPDQNQG